MNNRRVIAAIIKTYRLIAVWLICFTVTGHAQVLQQIQSGFNRYSGNTVNEKIYVHTDRSTYFAGEIIWFKLYCVDALTHKPLNLSKLAYVDILNNDHASILQAKVALNNGTGSGSFVISASSVVTGNYTLRAYTNWMKNFGAESFFEKKITIINVSRSAAAITSPYSYNVGFYPEGGNLVNGLESNVGFKVTGQDGKGVTCSGAVVDRHNDTIVRFRPLKFGMGHFKLTPAAGNSYKAVIRIADGKPLVKELPAAATNGYTMQVTSNLNDILVKVNGKGAGQVYLFVHTGQVIKTAQAADMAAGVATFTISKSKLDGGVTHITLFNETRQAICERLYFKRPKPTLQLSAVIDAKQYDTRKKVEVNVAVKDSAGKMQGANLSMAVYRTNLLQETNQDDIISYLWLNSDLQGSIESPGYYFKDNNAETDAALDNLMLTQGWRRFKWTSILQNKAPAFAFLPEYNGHLITAKITDAATRQPSGGVTAYLAVPGKRVQLYAAKSDSAGQLLFNSKELYGHNEIIVQTNTETDTTHRLEVSSPFAEQYLNSSQPDFLLTPNLKQSLEESSMSTQIQNVYTGNKLNSYYDPGVDSSGFFGKPFRTYKLDDFTRFLTMEEVLREYVREVAVSRSRGRFHITVHDENENLATDPLVLLDGIPIFDIDKVLALDPLKIRKLDVIRQRYYWGPSVYEGILSFTTYKGDLGGTEIDPHALIVDYDGMQLQREFYSPVYDTETRLKNRLPDFRNLLYWSPNINTTSSNGNKVSFYTSDQPGKYFGLVQGITNSGQPVVQTIMFEVK